MHPAARCLQALALCAFLALAALPLHVGRVVPAAAGGAAVRWTPLRGYDVPLDALGRALGRDLANASPGTHLWRERRWYPFALAPLWLLALAYGAGRGLEAGVRRRRAGGLLLALAAGLAVFEGFYLAHEYAPLGPADLGTLETVLVWLLVVAVLLVRRRGDRRVDALEAHVGAQALLGLMHLVTLPSSQARPWLGRADLGEVLAALTTNFAPAFWLGLGLLALAAAPVYLRRASRREAPAGVPSPRPPEPAEPAPVAVP